MTLALSLLRRIPRRSLEPMILGPDHPLSIAITGGALFTLRAADIRE
jgi:hypothetical protein